MDGSAAFYLGVRKLYVIEGHLYEQHGEYHVVLKAWADGALVRNLALSVYERKLEGLQGSSIEHDEILHVLMSALSRTAEKHERPLL